MEDEVAVVASEEPSRVRNSFVILNSILMEKAGIKKKNCRV